MIGIPVLAKIRSVAHPLSSDARHAEDLVLWPTAARSGRKQCDAHAQSSTKTPAILHTIAGLRTDATARTVRRSK